MRIRDTRQLLVDTRSRVIRERPTFHLFERDGRRILYDLWSGSLLAVSEAAYLVLSALEQGDTPEGIEDRLRDRGLLDELLGVFEDVERMRDSGFFELEPLETPEERDETVQAHLRQAPRGSQVFVQTSCNLKCTYCYEVQNGFHGTAGKMSWETGKASVDLLFERSANRPVVEITFFGGEPLLNFPLVERLVEYSKEKASRSNKKVGFKITTNGLLLDDETIAFLVEERFAVMLSIDGPPELNDIYRVDHGGRGRGAEVIEKGKRLVAAQREAGVKEACIRATMAKGNGDFDGLARYFESQGFRRVMIGASGGRAHEKASHDLDSEVTPAKEKENEEHRLNVRDLVRGVPGAVPVPRAYRISEGLERAQQALTSKRASRRHVMCGVGRNMTAVTAKGEIYPCHRYVGDEAFKLGDLDCGLDETKVEGYYRSILGGYDEHCSKCWARFACGGQCPWYLSKEDGSIGLPDEPGCDGIRRSTENSLALYLDFLETRRRKSSTQDRTSSTTKPLGASR